MIEGSEVIEGIEVSRNRGDFRDFRVLSANRCGDGVSNPGISAILVCLTWRFSLKNQENHFSQNVFIAWS